MKNLRKWFIDNGGYISKNIEFSRKLLKNNTQYNGIFILNNIVKDEKLLSIPNKLLLNYDNIILNDNNYHNLNETIIKSNINNKLKNILTFIIEKKKEKSFYKFYFDCLPSFKEIQNHPIYYCYFIDNEKLQKYFYLNKKIYKEIIETKKYINENFNLLFNNIEIAKVFKEENKEIALNEFLYSFILLTTRSWGNGFYPLLDNFNHSNYSKNILISRKQTNNQEIINKENNFDIGNEVYINYSVNDHNYYLFYYNFYISTKTYLHINTKFQIIDNMDDLTKEKLLIINNLTTLFKNEIYIYDNKPSKMLLNIGLILNSNEYLINLINSNINEKYKIINILKEYYENLNKIEKNEISNQIINILYIEYDRFFKDEINDYIIDVNCENLNLFINNSIKLHNKNKKLLIETIKYLT
jgi:hypothetical protein